MNCLAHCVIMFLLGTVLILSLRNLIVALPSGNRSMRRMTATLQEEEQASVHLRHSSGTQMLKPVFLISSEQHRQFSLLRWQLGRDNNLRLDGSSASPKMYAAMPTVVNNKETKVVSESTRNEQILEDSHNGLVPPLKFLSHPNQSNKNDFLMKFPSNTSTRSRITNNNNSNINIRTSDSAGKNNAPDKFYGMLVKTEDFAWSLSPQSKNIRTGKVAMPINDESERIITATTRSLFWFLVCSCFILLSMFGFASLYRHHTLYKARKSEQRKLEETIPFIAASVASASSTNATDYGSFYTISYPSSVFKSVPSSLTSSSSFLWSGSDSDKFDL